MTDGRKILPWVLCVGLLGAGCGPNELIGGPTVDVAGAEGGARDVVIPVRKAGRASAMEAAAAQFQAGGPPLIVYLNREGATLTGGVDDASQNRSSIVSGRATIPAFRGSGATWSQIVSCVRAEYSRFNVTVTDTRPAQGPYVMAMFGGDGSQLGYGSGVGGVAPMDDTGCTVIDGAVVYIFPDNLGINDGEYNCEVGAHEIGHATSLDHEYLAADPMTYLSYDGLQEFQDVDARCGEYGTRACACRRPSQNTVQILLSKLGPSGGEPPPPPPPPEGQPPEVSISSPADGEILPSFSTVRVVAEAVDDEAVDRVELLWKWNGAVFSCPGNHCTRSGSTYTFTLYVGAGERRFQVRATDRSGLSTTTPERMIRMQEDPGDALEVKVLEPVEGQEVKAGGTVQLTVQIKGARQVQTARMTWSGPAGSLTSDLDWYGGDEWGLNIQISSAAPAGSRQIDVYAEDVEGNTATAPPLKINLTR